MLCTRSLIQYLITFSWEIDFPLYEQKTCNSEISLSNKTAWTSGQERGLKSCRSLWLMPKPNYNQHRILLSVERCLTEWLIWKLLPNFTNSSCQMSGLALIQVRSEMTDMFYSKMVGLAQSNRKCLKVQVQSIKSTRTFLWSYVCSFIL